MFICLETCKKGWLSGCRPIIGMDVCFKGIWKGQLLVAKGKDRNSHILPIAWAIYLLKHKEN